MKSGLDKHVQLAFSKFLDDLERTVENKKADTVNTLSNIFSMRVFGNKTHGDLAEVGFTEFINRFVVGYKAKHVGKENFRSKKSEEDILVTSPANVDFPISLKAYGVGPLQLSTNKDSSMFNLLTKKFGKHSVTNAKIINTILHNDIFSNFLSNVEVLPFVYDEAKLKCNIMLFDLNKAFESVERIIYLEGGNGRKHPVYRFLGKGGDYLFEVRYGGTGANALQRGLWTNTKNAQKYFRSLTGGWLSYRINEKLLKLISICLVSSEKMHEDILAHLGES